MPLISIFCTIMIAVSTQNFNLSLSDQYLIHEQGIGIKAIGKNLQGNFLLSFQNGEAREYLSDFSSYTVINASSPVQQFQAMQLILSMTIKNGAFLNLTDRKIIFTSNGSKNVTAHHYYTYAEEDSYTVNQTILESFAFPINVLSHSQTAFVLACQNSVVVAYRGTQQQYSYGSTLLLGGTLCTTAKNGIQQISSNGNQLTAKVSFYMAIDKQVYRLIVTLKFSFNYTIDHFDLVSTSFSSLPIYLSIFPVSGLFLANGLLLVQSDNLGIKVTTIYNLNASLVGVALGMPLDQTIAFFFIANAFYILQKTGLIKLSYSLFLNTISVNAVMVNLPFNAYGLTLNSPINAFFILGKPLLYKAGLCDGQSYAEGNTCIGYSCTDPNCASCPIYPSLCSSNSTQTQYYYANSTSNTSDYETENKTQQSNNTQGVYYSSSDSFDESMMEFLLRIIKMLMSVPGARRVVSPIFYYFGVFDDLFFYQFHDRIYGETMNHVFENLNDIQTHKWSILSSQSVLAFIRVDFGLFQNRTDYQSDYNYYHFIEENHPQVISQGIWGNLSNFFIVGLPSIILLYILGRKVFNCLFEYPLSKLFRKFGFWWYLPLLIFDGNIEQFVFFQCTDWKNTFVFDLGTKFVKTQTILFGFCVIFVGVSFYFVSCTFYKKLRSYLMDNNESGILGQFALTIQFGVKNLCFGVPAKPKLCQKQDRSLFRKKRLNQLC